MNADLFACNFNTRNGALQAKLAKYSVYEKFLMKVLDQLPEGTLISLIYFFHSFATLVDRFILLSGIICYDDDQGCQLEMERSVLIWTQPEYLGPTGPCTSAGGLL